MSINTNFSRDTDKYWKVQTSGTCGTYRQTRCLGVVARTTIDAIHKVNKKFPDEKIVSINHAGSVDIP